MMEKMYWLATIKDGGDLDGEDEVYLLDEAPSKYIFFGDHHTSYVRVDGLEDVTEEKLIEVEKTYSLLGDEQPEHSEEFQTFLEVLGYSEAVCEGVDEIEAYDEQLYFDLLESIFFIPPDFDNDQVFLGFSYYDGSNYKFMDLAEAVIQEIVVDGDTDENLDMWDGSNWQYGGHGNHAEAYRIVSVDGKEPDEPKYLVDRWSQWVGCLAWGEVVDQERMDKERARG